MDHDYKKPSHCADCKAESNRRAETPHEYVNSNHCRACNNEYYRRRREASKHLAETPHPYVNSRHCPACRSMYTKEYHVENKQACNERSRKHYRDNMEAYKDRSRKYYAENTDECKATQRNWQRNNLDKCRASYHRRRARKAAVPSDGIPYPLGDRCEVCYATDNLTEEHLVALSRGGPDTIGNKATYCKSCNSSKRDMSITDSRFTPWLVERRMAAN